MSGTVIDAGAGARYRRDGYLIVEGLFRPAEVAVLREQVQMAGGSSFGDGGGRTARLSFWSDLEGHIWGLASQCPRIVNNVRILMQEDVGFFHGKVTLKEARTGGAWEWHQDYGYWYVQGFVFPRMMSVAVALDDNDEANGCMQVLRGSHRLGRLEHQKVGTQFGANPERLAKLMPHFEQVPAIMPAGSALFFDSLTLHTSGPNDSERHRRNFIMCYNALGNPQIGDARTSQSVPCPVVADDAIERWQPPAPDGQAT